MKSYMKFKIERETRWDASKMDIVTKYYIWAGTQCLALVEDEAEAIEMYDKIKNSYIRGGTVVILEEDVEFE
jgi:predicted nucleotidyltransferase